MSIIGTVLGCRLMQEQKSRRRAHHALAISALVAAHQFSIEQERRISAEDAAREKNAALLAADQLAAELARQSITEQQEHAAERDALRAQQAAAEQQAQRLITDREHQLSAAHAQLAQQDEQLRASQAEIARQEAQLSLLPKTMARATTLSQKLAAAEGAAADAKMKLKAERIKSARLAWVVEQTEHFAETLEALHDCLPHVSEVPGSISSPVSCTSTVQ